ncbi:hypothetical protein FB451DRAFT_1345086 [Mycena latifolia]|nr:hypothetical protein FB451DRAFT_1345086 [Mycena latifolia]
MFVVSGLVNLGLIPCSPFGPTMAITTRALKVFRVTRLQCPRLGIQPYVRMLCDIHGVPFRTYLSIQFSIAFDLYLATLAEVEKRVLGVLGRNTPSWQLKNAYPPCMYKLEGEAELLLLLLTTMDGNNSLRRFRQMSCTEEDVVEDWAAMGELRARKDNCKVPGDYYLTQEAVDKWAKEGLDDLMKGFSSEEEWVEEEDGCSKRWSNMREEITSRALGMYDETGIFLSLCRHGFVLLVADMIQSGELAKYGFAVIDRLIDVLGELGAGYDIGCKFGKMINAHLILGPRAREHHFRSLVGAFHRHTHNQRCQLCHLAIYGTSRNKSFFSKSNALAGSTRYATPFHRQQAIVTYLQHTDVFDTYQALSLNLVTKYKRALEIKRGARTLRETMTFVDWLAAEKEFLAGLEHEPVEEMLQMEYYQKLPGCKEWSAAAVLVSHRQYQRALDNLHGLVIARLFELTKCNMSGTALQAHSHAIKTAIDKYNAAAAALDVPHEALSWEEVVDYTFLSDFDLLHLARTDILSKGWAQPAGREAMDQYFKQLRTDEEIKRLNIEIPCLITYMRDEDTFLERQEAEAFAHQVFVYRMRQGRFNDGHRFRFIKLADLPGFSGSITPGIPINKERLADAAAPPTLTPEVPDTFDEAALGDDDKDDDEAEADTLETAFTVLRVTEDPAQ